MEKKNLISNWLNFDLNDKEKEAFDKLDVSDSYRAISEAAKRFRAEEIDVDASYQRFIDKREKVQKPAYSLFRYVGGIAAAIVVCLGLFYFLAPNNVSYIALNGENIELTLPDGSDIILNDGSELKYNESSWEDKRHISLTGEAYFDVEPGSAFTVFTQNGLITVVGTKFNIKDRNDYFEVSCYEGAVNVLIAEKAYELTAGENVKLIGTVVSQERSAFSKPSWLDKKSVFKSIPFSQVVDELERQYNIQVTGDLRDTKALFTGSFYHENLETALQAITIPLKLEFSINGDNVVLKSGN